MKNTIKIIIAFLTCLFGRQVFNFQPARLRGLLTIILFAGGLSIINAQVSINEDGSNPDASAILDVKSTDKGILIPRMTTSERTSISSPATGLMVYDNDENAFYYYNGSAWTAIGNGAFTSENNITHSANNNDDFVFGADSLNYGTGTETKFFFDKSNGAFRAGAITNNSSDVDSVGYSSFAAGYGVSANGFISTAFGSFSEASGDQSTAFGVGATASGLQSIAFGNNTTASGDQSLAFGASTTASGYFSTAFGNSTISSNNFSTAFGIQTTASGTQSTAFGVNTTASGYNAVAFGTNSVANNSFSTAFGHSSTAVGYFSTAFGLGTAAISFGEVAIGMYNTNYTASDTTAYNSADRLFVIGNGTGSSARSDAMIVYKNGNTELNGALTIDNNYTFPTTDGTANQFLTTDGSGTLSWADGSSIFSANNDIISVHYNYYGDDFIIGSADTLNYGYGTEKKLFFDNSKAAFRVGTVSGTDWDESNLGTGSFAAGINTKATGDYATAFGDDNTASGDGAFSSGFNNTSSGSRSVTFGQDNTASAYGSAAIGYFNIASGVSSMAFGDEVYARSYGEVVVGSFNTDYTPANANSFNTADRAFVVGNGDYNGRSDAMIVYKSGNTAINGALTIDNEYTFPTTDGTANQFLTTDGSGTLSWADGSSIFSANNNIIATHYNNYDDDFIIGSADTLNFGYGTETKLFFDNSKGAFRVGVVTGTNWDESNLGNYSAAFGKNTIASGTQAVAFGQNSVASGTRTTAFGYDTEASGDGSIAFGSETTASGIMSAAFGDNSTASGLTSIAFGDNTLASGDGSTAFGFFATASGDNATAFGGQTTASGKYSTAFGLYTKASSYAETTLGIYSTNSSANSTTSYNSNDRLFVIGNGTSSSARSDAMIVYKSGDTEINGKLTVSDTLTVNNPLIVNDFVGIGTTPTNADLEVLYSGNSDYLSLPSIGYLNTGGSGTGSYNGRFGIYTDGRIGGIAFIAHSDERIKNIIGQTNGQSDLEILNKIKITDYTMKDKVKYGDKTVKKVIAQQVAEVYPQAVSTNTTQIIPDIYQTATIDENGWVSGCELRVASCELKVGEKIQILFDNKKELLEILEVNANTFRIQPITNHESPITIFVYGRQVNDFHTVDYEAISMLNVSATQQLAKEVNELKILSRNLVDENEKLKIEISKINQLEHLSRSLVEQNAEMKAMLEQIQAQLNTQN